MLRNSSFSTVFNFNSFIYEPLASFHLRLSKAFVSIPHISLPLLFAWIISLELNSQLSINLSWLLMEQSSRLTSTIICPDLHFYGMRRVWCSHVDLIKCIVVEKANSIGFRCSDETDATFEQDSETWEMITL